MELTPGEYVFTCPDCGGDGSVKVTLGADGDDVELGWARCDDRHGDGTLSYDEEEAAEALEAGWTLVRGPAA